jgi:hypothetical protein
MVRVSDDDRLRILDYSGWCPGSHDDLAPGPEVGVMLEAAPASATLDELEGMAAKHISCAGADMVHRWLTEEMVEDLTLVPLADFM